MHSRSLGSKHLPPWRYVRSCRGLQFCNDNIICSSSCLSSKSEVYSDNSFMSKNSNHNNPSVASAARSGQTCKPIHFLAPLDASSIFHRLHLRPNTGGSCVGAKCCSGTHERSITRTWCWCWTKTAVSLVGDEGTTPGRHGCLYHR